MKVKLSISMKLMVFISVLSGIMVFLLTNLFYNKARIDLIDKFGLTLEHIAITAAPMIDVEKHQLIKKSGDENKKEFKEIKSLLKRIQIDNSLEQDSIYTFYFNENDQLAFR